MSCALKEHLYRHITQHGPLDVGQFMSIALCHPQYGYYMKQDPLGARGDFTTAPEISQIFGEIIGAWVADIWVQMGRPAPFGLVECGPGRGTLMADILRACEKIEGFRSACLVHLLEISPALKKEQAKTLEGLTPIWHQTLASLPQDYPLIVIGNEFLDALPFRQLLKTQKGWGERVIDENFEFGVRPAGSELLQYVPESLNNSAPDSIFEVSPARIIFMENLCALLKQTGGAGLFIDYGHDMPGLGDTFQALHKHEYVSVFEKIGDSDLTSHVDFSALHKAVFNCGAHVEGIVTQGAFLGALGIDKRAEYLVNKASAAQAGDIKTALHRLTSPDEMGRLFKVMGLSYGDDVKPAGF